MLPRSNNYSFQDRNLYGHSTPNKCKLTHQISLFLVYNESQVLILEVQVRTQH